MRVRLHQSHNVGNSDVSISLQVDGSDLETRIYLAIPLLTSRLVSARTVQCRSKMLRSMIPCFPKLSSVHASISYVNMSPGLDTITWLASKSISVINLELLGWPQ